jgi:hypothetical protein
MLSLATIVNVSVLSPGAGLASMCVNNLLVLTDETPVVSYAGAAYKVYNNPTAVATQWGTSSKVAAAANAVFAQPRNILTGMGKLIVAPLLTSPSLETTGAAITRLLGLVYFGGVGTAYASQTTTLSEVGPICAAARKMFFVVSSTASDLDSPNGQFYVVKSASQHQTRMLFHHTSSEAEALKWGYAGQMMSTDFTASRSTLTPHLKQIVNAAADESLDSSFLTAADAVGVDVYGNICGRPSIISSGTNVFYDNVYNLNWFASALQVAWFNAIATLSSKLPQTEDGMTFLKGELEKVCKLAVRNGMVAPGVWNSGDTFGDQAGFLRNILEAGYYMYSTPVAQQSQADREDRIAPSVQIAVKMAGAVHSGNVIVNFNA